MGVHASPSELVAIGIALGGVAAFAQLPLVRLRARWVVGGRTGLARATYPAGFAMLGLALLLAASMGPLSALSFLVGLFGARTLVIGDVSAMP